MRLVVISHYSVSSLKIDFVPISPLWGSLTICNLHRVEQMSWGDLGVVFIRSSYSLIFSGSGSRRVTWKTDYCHWLGQYVFMEFHEIKLFKWRWHANFGWVKLCMWPGYLWKIAAQGPTPFNGGPGVWEFQRLEGKAYVIEDIWVRSEASDGVDYANTWGKCSK